MAGGGCLRLKLLDAARHRHGSDVDLGLQKRAAAKLVEIESKVADLAGARGSQSF
jgi:hypothetical protein